MLFPKVPRLKKFDYKGPYAYFITICTNFKNQYFVEKETVEAVLSLLKGCASDYRFKIFAYCFMPDHLHILLQGEEDSSLKEFMRIFKQKTEWCFKKNRQKALWQKSYYDHVVRKDEAIEGISRYILGNPVRKGMVNDFRDYPFSGSMIFDINKM
ncbi:MAG: transposase [Deltaproteobacteria bacterium]|nr:transposase [Deltaproteobacteria bacterium]